VSGGILGQQTQLQDVIDEQNRKIQALEQRLDLIRTMKEQPQIFPCKLWLKFSPRSK
jgi:hypothetical protein